MSEDHNRNPDQKLRRRLNPVLLTLYGLGTTIGAGIFVLIGEIAAKAGSFTPVSFFIAALLAAPTALCFCELSSRFPKSAGEAVYVRKMYKMPSLALVVGLAVVSVGIVSSATITQGFIGYAQVFIALPEWVLASAVLIVMFSLAILGVEHSVTVSAVFSVIEIGMLIFIGILGAPVLFDGSGGPWSGYDLGHALPGIASGAVLAFFAFIGFEDMVNVAEEVRDVEKTMPRAILLTLGITLLLYLGFSAVTVAVLGHETLSATSAPVVDIIQAVTGTDGRIISLLVMLAIVNGVLIQMIMISRVLYGLSEQSWLPTWFGQLSQRQRVPLNATASAALVIWIFVIALPIDILARITSSMTLGIFVIINVGLLFFPKAEPGSGAAFTVPRWVCFLGAVGSLGLLGFQISRLFL